MRAAEMHFKRNLQKIKGLMMVVELRHGGRHPKVQNKVERILRLIEQIEKEED